MQKLRTAVDGDLMLIGSSMRATSKIMLFTTQPRRPEFGHEDTDGQSECYMSVTDKRTLLAIEGYPQKLRPNVSSVPPAYRIGPAGDRGMGMFASRAIRHGEYICSERPLLVAPAAIGIMGDVSRELSVNMTREELQRITLAELEMVLETMFKRLKQEKQEEYMSLANRYALPLISHFPAGRRWMHG